MPFAFSGCTPVNKGRYQAGDKVIPTNEGKELLLMLDVISE